jgi:hypothetical protein
MALTALAARLPSRGGLLRNATGPVFLSDSIFVPGIVVECEVVAAFMALLPSLSR